MKRITNNTSWIYPKHIWLCYSFFFVHDFYEVFHKNVSYKVRTKVDGLSRVGGLSRMCEVIKEDIRSL